MLEMNLEDRDNGVDIFPLDIRFLEPLTQVSLSRTTGHQISNSINYQSFNFLSTLLVCEWDPTLTHGGVPRLKMRQYGYKYIAAFEGGDLEFPWVMLGTQFNKVKGQEVKLLLE